MAGIDLLAVGFIGKNLKLCHLYPLQATSLLGCVFPTYSRRNK